MAVSSDQAKGWQGEEWVLDPIALGAVWRSEIDSDSATMTQRRRRFIQHNMVPL
jgi:hypothetical protein